MARPGARGCGVAATAAATLAAALAVCASGTAAADATSSASARSVVWAGASTLMRGGAEASAEGVRVGSGALAAAPAALLGVAPAGYPGLQDDLDAVLAPEPFASADAVLFVTASGASAGHVQNALRGAGFEIAAAAGVGGSAYDVSASVAQARELHSSGVRHVPLDCGAACGEGVANCTVEGAPEVLHECASSLGRAAQDAACAIAAAAAIQPSPSLRHDLLWFTMGAYEASGDAKCGSPVVAELVAKVAQTAAMAYGGTDKIVVQVIITPPAQHKMLAAHAARSRSLLAAGNAAPTEEDAVARFQFLAIRLIVLLMFAFFALAGFCCLCCNAQDTRDTVLFGGSAADSKKTR